MIQSLQVQNLQALSLHYPQVAAELEKQPPAGLRPLLDDAGAVVDLAVQGQRIYGPDARAGIARQVQGFLQDPPRIGFPGPFGVADLSPVSTLVHDQIKSWLAARNVAQIRQLPRPETCRSMIVLGTGLGLFLPDLIEAMGLERVIMIETEPALARGLLFGLDWSDLAPRLRQKGCRLSLVVAADPSQIFHRVTEIMRRDGLGHYDGACVFQHLEGAAGLAALQLLLSKHGMVQFGFFEDEMLMFANTLENLKSGALQLLDGRGAEALLAVPAYVVGSGPSLDGAIADLGRIRQRGVLISCSSSLEPLLAAGLVPDIHVEAENEWENTRRNRRILDRFADLLKSEGRTPRLVVGTTMPRTMIDLFDAPSYGFLRWIPSSEFLFGKAAMPVFYTDPLAANAGLAVAHLLGCSEVYLFGVDCGYHDPTAHHSKGSHYFTEGRDTQAWEGSFERPANFGGSVQTFWLLDRSRQILETAIAEWQMTVFNCSDGALIQGAVPRRPAEANPIGQGIDGGVDGWLAQFAAQTDAAAFFAALPLPQARRGLEQLRDRLIGDGHDLQWSDFQAGYGDLAARIDAAEQDPNESLVVWILRSSVLSIPFIARFYLDRMAQGEQRDQLVALFDARFKDCIRTMIDDISAVLQAAETGDFGGLERKRWDATDQG